MVSDDELEQIHQLWKKTSPGEWKAAPHGSRNDWYTEGPDILVPYMPQGDAEFIVAAHAMIPKLIADAKEMKQELSVAFADRQLQMMRPTDIPRKMYSDLQAKYFYAKEEVEKLRKEVSRLGMFETVLKRPLGHLVRLMNAAVAWRKQITEETVAELIGAVDNATSIEEDIKREVANL